MEYWILIRRKPSPHERFSTPLIDTPISLNSSSKHLNLPQFPEYEVDLSTLTSQLFMIHFLHNPVSTHLTLFCWIPLSVSLSKIGSLSRNAQNIVALLFQPLRFWHVLKVTIRPPAMFITRLSSTNLTP